VFPFAVYFAEAVGATIYALPYSQFCLQKTKCEEFTFVHLTGQYDDVGLRDQFTPEKLLKPHNRRAVPAPYAGRQENKKITVEIRTIAG
jgi:hypothetical protein